MNTIHEKKSSYRDEIDRDSVVSKEFNALNFGNIGGEKE